LKRGFKYAKLGQIFVEPKRKRAEDESGLQRERVGKGFLIQIVYATFYHALSFASFASFSYTLATIILKSS
tara:strand:- start:10764 stop:10976 length:213 start_codon:yes stop_codon:yes gene_type:complete